MLGVGLLLGLATSPMLVYYASADPQALWEAGGATALFIAASIFLDALNVFQFFLQLFGGRNRG